MMTRKAGANILGDRHIVFATLEGREAELALLMARFGVSGFRKYAGKRPLPEFSFEGDRTDFFLTQLRQAGFEFDEPEA